MGMIETMVYKLFGWMGTHNVDISAHHTKTVSGDINIQDANDVDKTAIGNDKILQYKTASGKHEYVVTGGATGRGFRAYRTSTQLFWWKGASTLMVFNLEYFDTNNEYDTTTGRYTPQVAGYYAISGNINVGKELQSGDYGVYIMKNLVAVAIFRGIKPAIEKKFGGSVSTIVYMNGTTDYLTMRFFNGLDAYLYNYTVEGYNTFSGWLMLPV